MLHDGHQSLVYILQVSYSTEGKLTCLVKARERHVARHVVYVESIVPAQVVVLLIILESKTASQVVVLKSVVSSDVEVMEG